MRGGPTVKKSDWGLHSIVTIEGVPYAVMAKWNLWHAQDSSANGMSVSMEAMPTDDIKMVPLSEMIGTGNTESLMQRHG